VCNNVNFTEIFPKKKKTILNNDVEKKNLKKISVPINFLNRDSSYQHEKIMRVEITQKN
jgi:hypothetical protein